MRYGISFLMAAVALLAMGATQPASAGMPGGYSPTKLTGELKAVLFKALENEKAYDSEVKARVCVSEITAVEQQVVAGMNYRFTTSACDLKKKNQLQNSKDVQAVGECAGKFAENCEGVAAVVTVYQSLQDALQVSSITTKADAKTPAGVHAAEM